MKESERVRFWRLENGDGDWRWRWRLEMEIADWRLKMEIGCLPLMETQNVIN